MIDAKYGAISVVERWLIVCGEGRARLNGVDRPGSGFLDSVRIETEPLTGRDAFALVNGTRFMTGYAATAVANAPSRSLAGRIERSGPERRLSTPGYTRLAARDVNGVQRR